MEKEKWSCEVFSRKMHRHVAKSAFCSSFAKRVNGTTPNQERGDSALQAAEWGRKRERRKKEKDALLAPTICQVLPPMFFYLIPRDSQ